MMLGKFEVKSLREEREGPSENFKNLILREIVLLAIK